MPIYEPCLDDMLIDFYYQKDSRTTLRIYDNIEDNEKELANVNSDANDIYSAIMEVECKKDKNNKSYFKNFADMSGESSILRDSFYCVYEFYTIGEIEDRYIIAKDGVSLRDWIYLYELIEFSIKLNENKKKIEAAISELVVSSGVEMALLYANYSQQSV